jgi:hypothetical protein
MKEDQVIWPTVVDGEPIGVRTITNNTLFNKDKWYDLNKSINEERQIEQKPIADVYGLLMMRLSNTEGIIVDIGEPFDNIEHEMIYEGPIEQLYFNELEMITEAIPHTIIDLWDATDQTAWIQMYAPLQGKMKSREMPQRIVSVSKVCMTRYPIVARAVHTKVVYEEQRSIAYRLHSAEMTRKEIPDKASILTNIANVYFCKKARHMIKNYQQDQITYDPAGTLKWLNEHPAPTERLKEVIELLAGGHTIQPMNSVNVHLKLESLFKNDPISYWQQQKARIIVWQHYAVAAIFSPIFTEAKTRLKKLLSQKIVYTDGLQPNEVANLLRKYKNITTIFENDLSKQDRQTDRPLLEVEFEIYRWLGVSEEVMSVWETMHKDWKYKASHNSGYGDAMRLTGQATTALGNFIVNMVVHAEFVKQNYDQIKLMLMLGDDGAFLCNGELTMSWLRKYMATQMNMQCKESTSSVQGGFCSMIIYRDSEGRMNLGPDVVRMESRFQVTNGVHEATPENLTARAMSYLMQLGDIPSVRRIIEKHNYPIKPVAWYAYNTLLEATAVRYNMSYDEVENKLGSLINMIDENQTHEYNLTYFTSQPRKW